LERYLLFKKMREVTLITGAGRGIGLEIANLFSSKRHDLILVIRKKKQIKDIIQKIGKRNNNLKILVGDLTNKRFLTKIFKTVPYVNNLINNASGENQKHFLKVSSSDLEKIVQLNIKTNFLLSQHFARRMVTKKIKGNIINISSQLGHFGAYDRTLYCMAKFATEGLTKSMAMDLGNYGIRVNSVSPTKTIVHDKEKKESKRLKNIRNKIPLKKFSTTSEIANIVYFLTTKHAASITGTSIVSDGGWTAGK